MQLQANMACYHEVPVNEGVLYKFLQGIQILHEPSRSLMYFVQFLHTILIKQHPAGELWIPHLTALARRDQDLNFSYMTRCGRR